MKRIYKYELNNTAFNESQIIEIPWCAEIVNIVKKIDGVFLYALIDTELGYDCPRKFRIYGTGWDIREKEVKYINSFLIDDYEIYHVVEVLDNDE